MNPSTRETISVRLRERQLIETINALRAVKLIELDAAAITASMTALAIFERALKTLQERP